MRYVALLRGINVGGKNLIRMAALQRAFEDAGHDEVSTYIQSGNVLFTSRARSARALEAPIERMLTGAFGYDATVVVRSKADIEKTLANAPTDWPRADTRCNVVFLKAPLTAAQAMQDVPARAGVDTVAPGPGALYFGTLMAERTKSHLTKIMGKPVYKSMTIRTYGTVSKIAERL